MENREIDWSSLGKLDIRPENQYTYADLRRIEAEYCVSTLKKVFGFEIDWEKYPFDHLEFEMRGEEGEMTVYGMIIHAGYIPEKRDIQGNVVENWNWTFNERITPDPQKYQALSEFCTTIISLTELMKGALIREGYLKNN